MNRCVGPYSMDFLTEAATQGRLADKRIHGPTETSSRATIGFILGLVSSRPLPCASRLSSPSRRIFASILSGARPAPFPRPPRPDEAGECEARDARDGREPGKDARCLGSDDQLRRIEGHEAYGNQDRECEPERTVIDRHGIAGVLAEAAREIEEGVRVGKPKSSACGRHHEGAHDEAGRGQKDEGSRYPWRRPHDAQPDRSPDHESGADGDPVKRIDVDYLRHVIEHHVERPEIVLDEAAVPDLRGELPDVLEEDAVRGHRQHVESVHEDELFQRPSGEARNVGEEDDNAEKARQEPQEHKDKRDEEVSAVAHPGFQVLGAKEAVQPGVSSY